LRSVPAKRHADDGSQDPVGTGVEIINSAGGRMIPAVASAVREAGVCYGLSPGAADELREACQALFRHVVASYSGDAEQARFGVGIIRRPGRLVVQIDDHAAPYELADSAGRGPEAVIGAQAQLLAFVRARVDRFRYVYRGRGGNRVELVKRVTRHRPSGNGPPDAEPIDPDQPVEVRPMVAGDAVGFVRNVYRSYGYTYNFDWAYHAEDVDQLLESGVLTAWVAATPDGALVGQAAVHREPPDARLGEAGAAMVDPAFRHHGVGIELGRATLEWIQRQQLFGVFALATTRHSYSQKAFLDMGGRELGLVLGIIPASVAYRGIELGQGRGGAMVMYQRFGPNPAHEVHAPAQHREMLRRIYEAARLDGDFVDTATPRDPSGETQMDIHVLAGHDIAKLEVARIGTELAQVVRLHIERLMQSGIAATYVDLPLSLPETPPACDELERLGLSFAGVLPFGDDAGMRLRLQYLAPDVVVQHDDIKVASDFGAELRDYVLAARASARPTARSV
jgi:GNAT superfamily N-acetyltransferase